MENRDKNRADRIINSLDGLHKTTAPDFFYTRLTGRMQHSLQDKKNVFTRLRPAFIAASLVTVLVLNVILLSRFDKQPVKKDMVQTDKPATIENFAEAYGMSTTTVYE